MITILCSGSRGDFQPYIALAQQLKKLGETVRITAGESHRAFVESYGIEVFPLSLDLSNIDIDPKMLENAGSSDNPLKMLLTFNQMKQYGYALTTEYYEACKESDLIIYHPGCSMGYFAAKALGIPCVLASPFPLHKTKEYLSVVMYGKSKSNPLSIALSYKMLHGMLWMTSKTSLKRFFKETFGKLPKPFDAPYETHTTSLYPSITSCSAEIFPKPQDLNPHMHQMGYWFVEEDVPYTPSAELLDFINQGEKPMYIGFGSMTSLSQDEALVTLVLDAIKKTGKRAIISGLKSTSPLPDTVFSIDSVPHSWLFNHVALVCHHGGAGTSAAGFAAGVPSVIIPFSNDQFAWAHRAYDLGIGVAPVYKKALTADKLATALLSAYEPKVVQKANAIGEKIRAESGAKDAAELIVQTLRQSQSTL